jgi:hypothetical protein
MLKPLRKNKKAAAGPPHNGFFGVKENFIELSPE